MPQGPLIASTERTAANLPGFAQLGKQNDLLVSQFHAERYTTTYQGDVGFAANQTGATSSAALATTYTGLCLSNPAGSGQNLSILRVSALFVVAPAALTAIGLIVGYAVGGITAHTTPLVVGNALVGTIPTNPLVGLADAACTLVGTPAWARWMAATPSATAVFSFTEDAKGTLLIPPGGYVAIGTSIAGPTAGLLASIEWEEENI